MKVYKAKMKRNESKKMPKRKEMKAQKVKMKGNEGAKGQNGMEMKAQNKTKIKENDGPQKA